MIVVRSKEASEIHEAVAMDVREVKATHQTHQTHEILGFI